jgi:hypothetical protein
MVLIIVVIDEVLLSAIGMPLVCAVLIRFAEFSSYFTITLC